MALNQLAYQPAMGGMMWGVPSSVGADEIAMILLLAEFGNERECAEAANRVADELNRIYSSRP